MPAARKTTRGSVALRRRPEASPSGLPYGRVAVTAAAVAGLISAGRRFVRAGVTRPIVDWAVACLGIFEQIPMEVLYAVQSMPTRSNPALAATQELYDRVASGVLWPLSEAAWSLVGVGEEGSAATVVNLPDRSSWLRAAMVAAATISDPRLPLSAPVSVSVPRYVQSRRSGLDVVVGEVDGSAGAMGAMDAGFERYREGVGRHGLRFASSGPRIVLEPFETNDALGMYFPDGSVRLYSALRNYHPATIAHVIAHEHGHHLWHTAVGATARRSWVHSAGRKAPLDLRSVVAAWPPGRKLEPMWRVEADIAEALLKVDPVLYLQFLGVPRADPVWAMTRAQVERLPPDAVSATRKPVTVYGSSAPEEAFCEAFGLLVAYGSRTVDSEHLAMLKEIFPPMRVFNPPRAERAADGLRRRPLTAVGMKARLRAYDLPVGGSSEALASRLARLDRHRATFGGDPSAIDRLSVSELRRSLADLGVKAWKFKTKAALVVRAARLAAVPEPSPESATRAGRKTWALVWWNPATLRREVHSGGHTRAAAEGLVDSVSESVRRAIMVAGKYDDALRDREPVVQTVPEPAAAYDPRGTAAEGAAGEALFELVRLEERMMGPALRGDAASLAVMSERAGVALERLRAARARVWVERDGDVAVRGNPGPSGPGWYYDVDWRVLAEMERQSTIVHPSRWVTIELGHDSATLLGPFRTTREASAAVPQAKREYRRRYPQDNDLELLVSITSSFAGWRPDKPREAGFGDPPSTMAPGACENQPSNSLSPACRR